MRKLKTMAVAAGLAIGAFAGSAMAQETTIVTVEVQAGALTLTAPGAATLTGAQFNANLPSEASGSFGNIVVTDGRGLTLPWTVSASSTNFSGSDPEHTIALGVTSPLVFGAATVDVQGTGVGVAAGGSLVAAGVGLPIATGTNGVTLTPVQYTWNPDLTLTIPANTPPQSYQGTVTLTVV